MQCDCSEVLNDIPMDAPKQQGAAGSSATAAAAAADDDGDDSDQEHQAALDAAAAINPDDCKRPPQAVAAVRTRPRAQSWEEGTTNEYQTTLCYVREFLGKPHPLVGRPGPTCPFVPTALRLNTVYITVIRTGKDTSRASILQQVKKVLPIFHELEPKSGRTIIYKAIIMVFPDVRLEDANEFIDQVQLALKQDFVTQGLMIGEFHQANNTSGLHNPNFYPLRTPFPSLAIRNMVPSDLIFMAPDQYSNDLREKFLTSYIKNFSGPDEAKDKKLAKDLDHARKALEALRAAAAKSSA